MHAWFVGKDPAMVWSIVILTQLTKNRREPPLVKCHSLASPPTPRLSGTCPEKIAGGLHPPWVLYRVVAFTLVILSAAALESVGEIRFPVGS